MFVPNFAPVPQVNIEILHWMSKDFDLVVALEEKFRGSPTRREVEFILQGP